MIGNHPFLVGRNDKDFHAALPAGDAKGIGGIRIVIDRQSQPAEPFANTPADLRVVLADPGGEDDTINAAERCGERAEFADSPPDEKLDSLLRSEEHTSELQSLMRISYAVFCLKKKKQTENDKYKQYMINK